MSALLLDDIIFDPENMLHVENLYFIKCDQISSYLKWGHMSISSKTGGGTFSLIVKMSGVENEKQSGTGLYILSHKNIKLSVQTGWREGSGV